MVWLHYTFLGVHTEISISTCTQGAVMNNFFFFLLTTIIMNYCCISLMNKFQKGSGM